MSTDGTHCILVVDDDLYVLESVSKMLKEFGYAVVPCSSGEEAISQLFKNDTTLVLTDIKMPGISGIEVLEKIHAVYPKMPVILMKGYAELDLAIDAIKKGAFDFITKPYNPDHLVHTITKANRYTELLQVEEDYKHTLEDTVKKQTQEIFNLSREVIQRLTAMAEFRDAETGSHISRIGLYASKIAEALNTHIDFIDSITYASSLHDIGKIGIPDNILLKPGKLTPEEFEIMKAHTTMGANMLADSSHSTIQLGASVALNHHERWDGTGYPRGLKGQDIPLEGRITMICDQYDALMSRRAYKHALDHKEVFSIITEGDGRTMPSHFAPDILDIFRELAPAFKDIFDENQD